MLQLIRNELFKVFKNRKMFIILGIVVFVSGITSVLMKINHMAPQGQELPLMMLTGSNMTDLFIPVFLIVLAVDMMTDDYGKGTLKATLIRPVSRSMVYGAKLITLFLCLVVILLVLLSSSVLLGTVLRGWGPTMNLPNDTVLTTSQGILLTIKSYGAALIPLGSFSAIVLLLGMLFSSGTSAIATSLGVLIGAIIVSGVSTTVAPYLFTTYLNLSRDMLLVNLPYSWMICMVVLGVYSVTSIGLGLFLFRKKDIVL